MTSLPNAKKSKRNKASVKSIESALEAAEKRLERADAIIADLLASVEVLTDAHWPSMFRNVVGGALVGSRGRADQNAKEYLRDPAKSTPIPLVIKVPAPSDLLPEGYVQCRSDMARALSALGYELRVVFVKH